MATSKTKNATKTLIEGASDVLERVVRIRRAADALINTLRRLDTEMTREKEDEALRRKHEEMQKAQSAHAKAYTMLDEDEKAQIEAVIKAEKQARDSDKDEGAEVSAAEASDTPAAADAAEPAKAADLPDEIPVKKRKKKAADISGAKTEKTVVKSGQPEDGADIKPSPEDAKKPDKADEAGVQPEDETAKKSSRRRGRGKTENKTPIGQIISRAGEEYPQQKAPVGLAPNVIRPPKPVVRPSAPATTHVGLFVHNAPAVVRQTMPPRSAQPAGQRQPGAGANRAPRPGLGGNRPAGQFGSRQPGQFGARQAGQPGGRPQGGGFGGRQQGGQRGQSRALDMTPTVEKERVSNYDPNKKNYIRQHDPEHVARNRKQASRNQSNFNGYDDEVIRGGKRSRAKKPSAQQMMAPIKIESATMAGDTITVRDLTEKIGKPAGEIIKKLFMLGNMATINSEIDFDTAQLVCSDFEITLERKMEQTAEAALVAEEQTTDIDADLMPRSPVVTIMGHVDHGKTSLLDYIRKSRVTAGEAGGITQHIGAYTVDVRDGRSITFLDTPGHEAFTAMRARGTQATDIAVLVVAADDSVMPQTVESINHAKAADVPIIVAINKMDKPEADAERVKQDLTQYGLVCEDWGGDTICVPVSALTGKGVDDLLEMILLQADMLQLQANPDRLGRGVIIEAKLDKARGPLATVLVQNGTLHTGDFLIAGMASGRVRALINDRGQKVSAAGPSMPVEIMGFDDVPSAGDEMIAVGDEHLSRQVADERREKLKASREASMAKMSMENLFSSIEAGKTLTMNLIIKADVQGSVEAVKQAAEKLSTDEVKVRVLHSAAGAITQDDVNLANAFNAIIVGFNIRPDASAREAAEKAGVDIRLYTVIYQAIEDMELAMKGMLKPEYKETLIGHAEVRNIFKITGVGTIAGCYVQDGKVQRNAGVRLLRDQVVVFEGKLSSLKHLKDDVKEMAAGFECGMSLEGHNDIKEGDIVECYIMEEIPR